MNSEPIVDTVEPLGSLTKTEYMLSRFNAKAAAMLIALLLACGGIAMIFLGIKETGTLDVKTPFLTGELRSGFVGLFLILIGMLLAIFSCFVKKPRHKVTLKRGDIEVQWEGVMYSFVELREFQMLINRLDLPVKRIERETQPNSSLNPPAD
ncbi:MAG: hypothetical protein H0W28_10315 [Pyrinomonadaceae bacterium]|nr:hypothetical protein [Pyrinomonadaceae bacterium]